MSAKVDISNQIFTRLRVVRSLGSDKWGKQVWECICECGNLTRAKASDLKMQKKKSCGCLLVESSAKRVHLIPKRFVVDPATKHPLYGTWKGMKSRCSNPNTDNYKFYGGRGIKVSPEWNSFSAFKKDMYPSWVEAVALYGSEYTTLERVDNSLGYSKDNTIWVSRKDNCNNTRRNIYIELNGVIKTITEWAREYKKKPSLVYKRYKIRGWSIDKALITP